MIGSWRPAPWFISLLDAKPSQMRSSPRLFITTEARDFQHDDRQGEVGAFTRNVSQAREAWRAPDRPWIACSGRVRGGVPLLAYLPQ